LRRQEEGEMSLYVHIAEKSQSQKKSQHGHDDHFFPRKSDHEKVCEDFFPGGLFADP
jgi:hypothetical protein